MSGISFFRGGDGDSQGQDHDLSRQYDGPNPNAAWWKLGAAGHIAVLAEGTRGRVIAMDGNSQQTQGVIDTIKNDAAFLHASHFLGERDDATGAQPLREVGFHVALTAEELPSSGELKFGYALYHGDVADRKGLTRVGAIPIAQFLPSEAASQPHHKRVAYMHTLAVTRHFVVLFGCVSFVRVCLRVWTWVYAFAA